MTSVTSVTPNSLESWWSHIRRIHLCAFSSSLPRILINSLAHMSWADTGMLTYHAEVPPQGGDEHSHLPPTRRHSAPIQKPSEMYCFVVIVGRVNLGIADIPLHARRWFFLKIRCVVKAADTNKSIQMLEAYQECPQRQTDKTHRAAWTNLQPAENRGANKSEKWSK